VVVLHDLAIQELCRDMVHFDNQSPDLYLSEMETWYGEPGAEAARKFLKDDITPYNLVATMPGFEIALGRTCAVLTHTDKAFAAVKARTDLPCYQLNLPYPARTHHWPRPKHISDRLRLVQFGHIGPTRRPEQILEALAEVRHEIDFKFDILGKLWDPAHVQNRIDDLGLTD
jgi:glycosyltransferase involved in cell wall biosynthesis